MAAEVDGQARRELALRCLDAVAGAVLQQGDRLAVLDSGPCSLEGLITSRANLGNVVARLQRARIVTVVYPLVASGSG